MIAVVGGTPAYSENWNTIDPANIGAGNFSMDVTDAQGCSVMHSFSVTQPAALTVSLSTQDEVSGNDGQITVTSGGGTPSYEYSINAGIFGSNNVFTNLSDGFYSIDVQDANGCSISDTASVNPPSSVGVNEAFLNGVMVYPVPMGNQLFVEFNSEIDFEKSVTLTFVNVLGELICKDGMNYSGSNVYSVNVADFPGGTYILRIEMGGAISTFKIVK